MYSRKRELAEFRKICVFPCEGQGKFWKIFYLLHFWEGQAQWRILLEVGIGVAAKFPEWCVFNHKLLVCPQLDTVPLRNPCGSAGLCRSGT